MAAEAVAPIIEVAQKYHGEFLEVAQILQHQAQQAVKEVKGKAQQIHEKMIHLQQETDPKVRQLVEKTQVVIQDMGPVDAQPKTNQMLLENYLWSAICLLGLGCGKFIGRHVLRYPLALFLDTGVVIALLFVLLPSWFFMFNWKSSDSKNEQKMKLFCMGLAAGVLSGYNLSDYQLPFFVPPAFLLPLTLGLICSTVASNFANDRRIYLGITVGSAAVLYLLFGLIFRSLGLGYLLWVALAAGMATVNLQMQLGRIREGKLNVLVNQFCVMASAILVESLMTLVLGKKAE